MKKNWFLRIGLIVLVLTLATCCFVGGTFAKYTTTVSGSDTVKVARFGFGATDGTDAFAADMDLFDDVTTDATGTVTAATMAPGSYGSFVLVFDNTNSDVDVTVAGTVAADIVNGSGDSITVTGLTTSTAFISYYIASAKGADAFVKGTTTYTATRASLAGFATDLDSAIDALVIEKGTKANVYVHYEWIDASANDAADTAIGTAIDTYIKANTGATVNAELAIDATGAQVMTASPTYAPAE